MKALADQKLPLDDVGAAVEQLIAHCDGDARLAVRQLVAERRELERELAFFRVSISSGFSRQWHHRRWRFENVETKG